LIFSAIKFIPAEWGTFDTQAPNIVDGFLTRVTAKHKEVRFTEDDGVTVSAAGSTTDNRDDHPLCHRFTISHIEKIQVIGSQTATASRTSVDDHLHLFDVG
jgi:hypothetical protein